MIQNNRHLHGIRLGLSKKSLKGDSFEGLFTVCGSHVLNILPISADLAVNGDCCGDRIA